MMESKNDLQQNTIIGIIVIIIGALFLSRNFGIFPGFHLGIIFKWQVILIIIGIITYVNSGNKSLGSILVLLGIIGFIPNFWSLLLIGLGIYVLYKEKSNSSINIENETEKTWNEADYISDTAIFGGSKKIFQIDNFRGGNITAIFGGSEINLQNSNLAEGRNILNLFFLFGGSNIRVPSNWNVVVNLTPIFGGFKDKRVIIDTDNTNDKILIIKGFILFGGGDLLN